jgi:2-hydroxy-3-keto-5-methylthiopentenyl-1-phosphate phosphatase
LSECKIDVSKLEEVNSEKVNELREYLDKKLGVNSSVDKNQIVLSFEEGEETLSRRAYLRKLLKKYLHRAKLTNDFRVISGGKDIFIIKNRKKPE